MTERTPAEIVAEMPPEHIVAQAVERAQYSACRSQRGVVVFQPALAAAAGISAVWLHHEIGWRRYPMVEFHSLSEAASNTQQEVVALLEVTRQERDKWIDNFNRSEQFQSGPTKRAEVAEAEILTLRNAAVVATEQREAAEQATADLEARLQQLKSYALHKCDRGMRFVEGSSTVMEFADVPCSCGLDALLAPVETGAKPV